MKRNKFRKSFRKNKETQHPAYLVNKNDQGYDYIGLTHSPTTNDKENIKLNQNPNPDDTRDSYIIPEVKEVSNENLGRRYNGWSFCDKDKKKVEKVIEENKKSRK